MTQSHPAAPHTRRKSIAAVEQQLRRADERLDLALRCAGIGTWEWNVGEDVMTWDEHLHRLFGLAPGQFGGSSQAFLECVHPDDQRRVEMEVKATARGKVEFDTEFRVVLPDATNRVIHAKGKVYSFDGAKPARMTGVCWDVTSRARAEKKLRVSHEKLERINEELQQFAYVASHDLREPLRTVRSFCELFTSRYRGQLDEKADVWLDFMADATSHMQQLIDDLLTYSRLETHAKSPEPTDCNAVMRDVVQLLGSSIEEAGAEVTFGELPTVSAEPSQVAQLFQNLISNAVKYRSEHPRIHVSAETESGGWKFAVRDNGIGIKAEFFDKIFDLFRRLHARDQYSGTGIGLAACRKIVQRHGGRIWLESKIGIGTTFYFTLPNHHDTE